MSIKRVSSYVSACGLIAVLLVSFFSDDSTRSGDSPGYQATPPPVSSVHDRTGSPPPTTTRSSATEVVPYEHIWTYFVPFP